MNTQNSNLKYLITTEFGEHFLAKEYTSDEFDALCEGILTIIRIKDGFELNEYNEWNKLPEWKIKQQWKR